MGRLFCIVRAMISYLLWNICSWPRSDMVDVGWLFLYFSRHRQKWQPPVAPHLQTHGHWKWSLTVPGLPYSRYLDIQGCAADATKETTPLYCVGDTSGEQKPALLLCPPPPPIGCGTGLPPCPTPSFLGWQHSSLPALLRSFEPALAVTQCLQLVI